MSEIPLRDYIEQRLSEMDRRYEQRFESTQEALKVAFQTSREALTEAKQASVVGFEKSNEWRASLNDVMGTRLARTEYDTQHQSLMKDVATCASRLDKIEARAVGTGASWRDVLTILAVLIALGVLLVTVFHKVG